MLAVLAIPLAPALYDDHVAVLVLLRPTKEVFLLAGYLIGEGDLNLVVTVFAAVPLMLLAVWVFYLLGRAFGDDLGTTDLPGLAGRLLPRSRVRTMRWAVADQGWPLVFLGRLAVMPSTLVAAAAGASAVPDRTFFLADAAGAALSMSAMLAAGWALGETRETAGPWFTVAGAIALLGILVLLGRRLTGGARTRRASVSASRS